MVTLGLGDTHQGSLRRLGGGIQGHMGHCRKNRIPGSGEQPPRLAPLCPAVRSGPCVTGRVMSEDACLRLCRGFGVRMVVGFTERQLGPKALQSQL